MIESDGLIESIEAWTRDTLAIDNDLLLGALVTLRLETSAAFTFMGHRQRYDERTQPGSLGPLLSILNRRIDSWENAWSQAVDKRERTEEESCHGFLISFYGCHLRLQLSSLQLEGVLSSVRPNSPNLDSLWIAYSSALQMLRLIPRHSNHLIFTQDSVHIMLAYGAAFLVKVSPTLICCTSDSTMTRWPLTMQYHSCYIWLHERLASSLSQISLPLYRPQHPRSPPYQLPAGPAVRFRPSFSTNLPQN